MNRAPLLLAAALLAGTAACSSGSTSTLAAPTPSRSPVAYHGVEPVSEVQRPSWTLTDTDGKTFDFAKETSGKATFVYFGYTNCPDECPTAMADIASALRKQAALADQVKVVFVTTDPARDSALAIRRFLDQFSTDFIGVRGTIAEIAAAEGASGVPKAYPEGPVPTLPGQPNAHPGEAKTAPHKHFAPLGYSVAHSSVIYAYDATDRLPVVYPGGVTPSDIAADLPELARA